MKLSTLLFAVLLILTSCGSDDTGPQDQTQTASYVSEISSVGTNGTTELRFTYDSNNNLIKNGTDTYERLFTYVGNNISKIESITLPNTPFYTINFIYDSNNRVIEVKRDNHHNGTLFYVTYDYNSNGQVSRVCTYNSLDEYNNSECNRFYEISYIAGTSNYAQKDLVLNSLNGTEFLEVSNWNYDGNDRPYFGEAVKRIQLPYATDGTGIDWEYTYNSNNPTAKFIFDFNTNEYKLRRQYIHQYNNNIPSQSVIQTYDIFSGNLTSTFTQNFTYELR